MAYEIDKSVPIPDNGRGKKLKYPLRDMEVGDSFTVPISERTLISSSITHHSKKHGRKFATRSVSDDTLRIWRIK